MNGGENEKRKKKRTCKENVKNQTLWGVMLFPSFWVLLGIYMSFSIILAIFGGAMLGTSLNVNDLKIQYDDQCTKGST